MKFSSTKDAASDGRKFLVYGGSGIGKTAIIGSIAEPALILSAEAGLLPLRGHDIPVIEIRSMDDLIEAYRFVSSSAEARNFRWICLDSISEIAEVVLATQKDNPKNKDIRQAYGATQDLMTALIRDFRDLPGKHVYFSAKMERVKDEQTGGILYSPSMPGQKLGQSLSYFFDFVFCYRIADGDDKQPVRTLQTGACKKYFAKDRSGNLEHFEYPDFSAILDKIDGK